MTFWNTFEKATSKPKQEIIRNSDLVDLIDKDAVFSTKEFTPTRFVGPMFGVCSIVVPIIQNGRFFRKKDTNRMIAIPKQILGYDYRTKQLDESKCPYLQFATLDNETLLVAVINYVKDSTIQDKDYLLASLENEGLKNTYWTDKRAKDAITSNRDLQQLLSSIATRGTKEYYSNIIAYSEANPITEALQRTYTDASLRTASENTAANFLDYSANYGLPVFLKASKSSSAPTPVKVLKMSEKVLTDLFNDVVKLNTVTIDKETRAKEVKGIEDPEFGCEVLVRLDELSLRTAKGEKIHTLKFSKGDRAPLTENEKKYLLWDLTKLTTTETYDQAHEWLKGMGYCDKPISSKVQTFDPAVLNTPQAVQNTVQASVPAPQGAVVYGNVVAPVAPTVIVPQEAVTELPWEDEVTEVAAVAPTPVAPVVREKPVKAMVKAIPADDFDDLFDK